MNDTAWRMAWALPLVMVIGVVAMVLIKRVMDRLGVAGSPDDPMTLQQSLQLSDGARAHLLSIGTHAVLVVESGAQPVVQILPAQPVARAWPALARSKRT